MFPDLGIGVHRGPRSEVRIPPVPQGQPVSVNRDHPVSLRTSPTNSPPRWPLRREDGWYAEFTAADDQVAVLAERIFRYRRGDTAARGEAVAHGHKVGTY